MKRNIIRSYLDLWHGKFRVNVPKFSCVEYTENDHKLLLDIDAREDVVNLYYDLISHWEEPYAQEIIPPEEKEQILTNIYAGLKWMWQTTKVKIIESKKQLQ